jgi:type IV pilus assembly protein PilC
MPSFVYQAKTRTGESRRGELEAADVRAAGERLRAQGLLPTSVRPAPTKISFNLSFCGGVTTKDLVVFTRQFATMIDAGLPLVQCLDLLGSQASSPALKVAVLDIKATVEGGKTLADGLRRHPRIFNRLYVNLVAAGEASGMLDAILNRLSVHIEKNMKLAKRVRGAMVYPAVVFVVALIVTVVLLVFVIPVFQKMFKDSGQELPGITQWVIDLSAFVRTYILHMMAAAAATIWGVRSFVRSPRGIRFVDRTVLYIPIVSPLVRKVAVAKFTRTLGTMLSSGVNILDALEIVAGTAGNTVIEEGLLRVRARISEGVPMAQPLAEMPIFPHMVVQMIAVGESTGAMDAMLMKIADFYDDEVDAAVGTMMAMLEPLIMSVLAVLLGGLVISMYLPVFTMAGSAGA